MLAVPADVSAMALERARALDEISIRALHDAANRSMSTFLDALAAGCSDSQWP
jgi:hypothetical protein